jgi:hypothetical protein
VHQRTPTQTCHLREFPEALRYNSPDCPVHTGQCPVLQGTAPQELASFGKTERLLRYNSPVHQRTPTRTRHLREFLRPARYNSPDCPVYTRQCPVLQGSAASRTRQPRDFTSSRSAIIHRTVRCTSGVTTISAPTATCGAFNARSARAEGRRAHTGAPDNEQELSGVHRTSRRAQKSEAPTVRIQRH